MASSARSSQGSLRTLRSSQGQGTSSRRVPLTASMSPSAAFAGVQSTSPSRIGTTRLQQSAFAGSTIGRSPGSPSIVSFRQGRATSPERRPVSPSRSIPSVLRDFLHNDARQSIDSINAAVGTNHLREFYENAVRNVLIRDIEDYRLNVPREELESADTSELLRLRDYYYERKILFSILTMIQLKTRARLDMDLYANMDNQAISQDIQSYLSDVGSSMSVAYNAINLPSKTNIPPLS